MINLSTTASAHAYACRPGGSNVVVVSTVSPLRGRTRQRRNLAGTGHQGSPDAVANGGLEVLGQGFVGINGFRNNRFQYQIPTVGQHYGNAFHLGDDDEEVTTVIGEHHPHVGRNGSATGDAAGALYLQDIMAEHANGDDEEEDVEMSTAVEVISIDPDCDYDTEDEDDEEDEDETDEEDDEDDEYEEEDHCKNGGRQWFSKGGNLLLGPSANTAVHEVMHNVSLTVGVAHEVIGPLRSTVDGVTEKEIVDDIRCDIITLPSAASLPAPKVAVNGGRSRSNSCSSTASSSSRSSSDSSTSSTSIASSSGSKNVSSTEDHHHSDTPSLEFNPTRDVPFELPEQLLQLKAEPDPVPPLQLLQTTAEPRPSPAQHHRRRKRTSTSQRLSFSMPHSPVGAIDGVVGALIPTSFSFEDLDSIVGQLSPLKALAGGEVKATDSDLDDSLVDELANGEQFDLAEYITGDDSTTSCDTNGYFSERKRPKADHQPAAGDASNTQHPKHSLPHPKSRGKELKVLRQLMLPQKQNTRTLPNANPPAVNGESQPLLNGKRSCTVKVLSRLTIGDDNSDSEEDNLAKESTGEVELKQENVSGTRKGKRKALDDTTKDPTWNPNGNGSAAGTRSLHAPKVCQKQSPQPQIPAGSGSNANREDGEKVVGPPTKSLSAAGPMKGIKFGQVVRKDSVVTVAKKSSPNGHSSLKQNTLPVASAEEGRRPDSARSNVLRKKTNVKLDHDYCSPKNGVLLAQMVAGGGGTVGSPAGVGGTGVSQRKTIEIPFLLPTKDQLRQERKLQKEKHRHERAVAKKAQEQEQATVCTSNSNGAAADNRKDKQKHQYNAGSSSSEVTAAQKTAPIPPMHYVGQSPSSSSPSRSSCGSTRTEVDNTSVHNSVCADSVSSDSANEVTQPSAKKLSAVGPVAASHGVGAAKRQVSLLKINQTCVVPRPTDGDAGANHVSSQVKTVATNCDSGSPAVQEEDKTPRIDAAYAENKQRSDLQGAVIVRRKLNLQEYKKRREHPQAAAPADSVNVKVSGQSVPGSLSDPRLRACPDNNARNQAPDSDRNSDSTVNVLSGYSSNGATGRILEATVNGGTPLQPPPVTLVRQEPLDPISAAKMKALRMQQLKKEAAIKSNEAKLNQKTMPLMPIVPLAQITSLEFDEHGNPLSLDEAYARGDRSLKLHPDYEEITIVSVGSNTALSIVPGEAEPAQVDPLVRSPSKIGCSTEAAPNGSQQQTRDQKEASTLNDTIKRCCSSVSNMPGSSLIASIQEVVNKKSNSVPSTVSPHATIVAVEAAESAITLKADPGAAAGRPEQYELMHQSSPHVGVSPPSSFSPGKPERAHTSNAALCGKQGRTTKTEHIDDGSSATLMSVTSASQATAEATATAAEHGEDKVIMHLRKDRPRPPGSEAACQTEPSTRFPPLRKLSPSAKAEPDRHRQQNGRKHSERRSYWNRRRDAGESSGAESDVSNGRRRHHRSSRSKSRTGRDRRTQDRSRSRSRQRSERRRRASRTRSSCSRSRSRSGYSSHRVHRDGNHHQQQHSSGAGAGHFARSRRKSRTSSRSSSSSSLSNRGCRRSLSGSSSASSMSSRSSRSRRSRSPRSSRSGTRSRSNRRSTTPPTDQRFQSREHLNHRRPMSPERKIVYVGRLECSIRKEDLQLKFQPYGKIIKITLHSKDNGLRYGFVTFEKPSQAYSAIDSSGNDPNLREYDISFGGRRAFCRTQYADLDGELSNDLDHHIPYVALDGSLVLPARVPIPYSSVPVCHKEPINGAGGGSGVGTAGIGSGGGRHSFEDLLMQFKKGMGAMKPRKT